MKEIFYAFLSKTLNMDKSEIASLVEKEDGEINESALENLISLDTKRVQTFKDKHEELFNNGYKKAEKEVRKKVEDEIKAEFEVESDKKGTELIKEVLSSKLNAEGKKTELTDDKIKSSKVYQDMVANFEKQKEEALNSVKTEFEQFKSSISEKETMSTVNSKALELIKSKNPVLPENQEKANRMLKLALNDLSGHKYEIQGDRILVKDKEGKLLEDEHGHPVKFESVVNQLAESTFDFKEAGKNTPANQGGGAPNVRVEFKSEQDYLDAVGKASSFEEQVALTKQWEEHSSK